jgi:hypothetical protein
MGLDPHADPEDPAGTLGDGITSVMRGILQALDAMLSASNDRRLR